MRLMVTGSRHWDNYEIVHRELAKIMPTEIIEGGAPGLDTLAKQWGVLNGIPVIEVEAQWKTYGKKAGPLRNGWMLDLEPDLVIGFPMPDSRGTWDAINQAVHRGIDTIVVWDLLKEPNV